MEKAGLSQIFAAGGPVSLPWFGQAVQPATAFDSSKIAYDDPVLYANPFDYRALQSSSLVFEPWPNQRGIFASTSSTRSGARSEHFSMSGGISIGGDFLGASGSAEYDKRIWRNTSTCKSSQRASVRQGILRFATPPVLSSQAAKLLRAQGGAQQFRKQYGDYFVAGYALGADCGIMLSTDVATGGSSEAFSYVLEAHAFIFSKSWEGNESKFSAFSSISSSATCFDTLTGANENLVGNLKGVSSKGTEYAQKTDGLQERFDVLCKKRLKSPLSGQVAVSFKSVMDMLTSNLVAEVMLQPYTSLREYAALV